MEPITGSTNGFCQGALGRDHLPEENVEGPMLDTRRGFDMDMTVVVGVCRRSLRPRTSLVRVWSLGPR